MLPNHVDASLSIRSDCFETQYVAKIFIYMRAKVSLVIGNNMKKYDFFMVKFLRRF